jgi:hypothetical protein
MAHGHRLSSRKPSFDQASLVGTAGFSGVLVAEVDLNPRDLITEVG